MLVFFIECNRYVKFGVCSQIMGRWLNVRYFCLRVKLLLAIHPLSTTLASIAAM
ncbi:Uncharacterised protein [Serratia quinivorans]|uniref:Uncharacterized protein n=1 Tax=Serratia quinivorans TaxID=137545 RepID=A0A379YZ94_9GAMM|nr:Uncharacterised protein [Serratia quinivorans]SUI52309.1 Uncharacterised protein [Serratia quinivorans]